MEMPTVALATVLALRHVHYAALIPIDS